MTTHAAAGDGNDDDMTRYRRTDVGLVSTGLVISAIVGLTMGCGSDDHDDGGDPPGVLEYEIPTARFYRQDRRIDVVGVDPTVDRSGCGFLTDRAYDDLVGTLGALDSGARYDWSGCDYRPDGMLYLDDFEHSPFECNWYCCNVEILPIGVAYFGVVSNIYGQRPNIEGEPYVALEPDVPCPD